MKPRTEDFQKCQSANSLLKGSSKNFHWLLWQYSLVDAGTHKHPILSPSVNGEKRQSQDDQHEAVQSQEVLCRYASTRPESNTISELINPVSETLTPDIFISRLRDCLPPCIFTIRAECSVWIPGADRSDTDNNLTTYINIIFHISEAVCNLHKNAQSKLWCLRIWTFPDWNSGLTEFQFLGADIHFLSYMDYLCVCLFTRVVVLCILFNILVLPLANQELSNDGLCPSEWCCNHKTTPPCLGDHEIIYCSNNVLRIVVRLQFLRK